MDEIDDEVLTALDSKGGRATAAELADLICGQRGFAQTCQLTASILRGYLGGLECEGRVSKDGDTYTTQG